MVLELRGEQGIPASGECGFVTLADPPVWSPVSELMSTLDL